MISQRVAKLLHEQVGHELYASHQYLAIAAYFGEQSLDGWADFYYRQSDEERGHALKIARFLVEVGAKFTLPALPECVPDEIQSPLDAARKSLNQERGVTQQFKSMNQVAHEDNDAVSIQFLAWFLNEQVEEENSMDRIVKILESGLNPFLAESLVAKMGEHEG